MELDLQIDASSVSSLRMETTATLNVIPCILVFRYQHFEEQAASIIRVEYRGSW